MKLLLDTHALLWWWTNDKQLSQTAKNAILDEGNPGDLAFRTGRPYPRDLPLSTVPASVLGVLPTLPADVQYRFVNRDLILYDTRANMMLDRVPAAIRCSTPK